MNAKAPCGPKQTKIVCAQFVRLGPRAGANHIGQAPSFAPAQFFAFWASDSDLLNFESKEPAAKQFLIWIK